MNRQPFVIALLLLCSTASAAPPAPPVSSADSGTLSVDRIDGSTIFFKAPLGPPAPKPLKLNAIDLIQLGELSSKAPVDLPYFIFRARPCAAGTKDCKRDPIILVFQPSGYPISKFVEPGKILDNKTRVLVAESRAFFGECLAKTTGDVLVFFQKDRVDKKRGMQPSVLVVAPALDPDENGKPVVPHLHEVLLDRRMPRIEDTLRRVRKNLCHEIDGRNRIMASRPLDVNLKHGETVLDEDKDEPDDAPDESDASDQGTAPAAGAMP